MTGNPWDERLDATVRRRFPEAEVRALTFLGEGDFCRAYVLGEGIVLRAPKHAEADAALAREARLLSVLADRLPLPVPRPRYLAAPDGIGTSVAVHERLEGVELTRERWERLGEPMRRDLPAQLGRFLRTLHDQDPALGVGAGLRTVDHGALIRDLAARTAPDARSPLPAELQRALNQCFRAWEEDVPPWRYAPAVVHADLSPGHVLVDMHSARVTGIIDWGDAVVGDPARDFIFLYEDWGPDFLELVLAAYADPVEVAGLRTRALLHYLADQLVWTVGKAPAATAGRGATGADTDFRHGVAALERGVEDFNAALRRGPS